MFAETAAAISIGSSILGFGKSRKARKAAKKAAKLRAQITTMENARERRNLLRDFRQQRASTMVGAGAMGIDLSSSMIAGQAASLGAQTESGLAYLSQANRLNAAATRQEIRSSNAAGMASTFGAISSAAGAFAQATGGYDSLAGKMGIKLRDTT